MRKLVLLGGGAVVAIIAALVLWRPKVNGKLDAKPKAKAKKKK